LRRAEIASGTWGGIVEGRGWHEIEYEGGQPFRWAEGGARIELAALASTWLSLDVDIEPGPSLQGEPLQLEVFDSVGKCVARVDVGCRQVANIVLPVHPIVPTLVTLEVRGDAYPVPGDPRRLCYRIFSIRQSGPLLSPMLRFESGWHAYEKVNGQLFRWASNGASIQVHAVRANPILTADLEPGPGTQRRPFRVDILTPGRERIFTTSISTRAQILARLPLKLGDFGVFHFSADESMVVRAPQDSRDLVFRTFGMAIG
jgi:hypothetical protein